MASPKRQVWIVKFTKTAEDDLREILLDTMERYSPRQATKLLGEFEKARHSLRTFPFRFDPPEELKKLNVYTYRECQVPPFRMIYEPDNASKLVHIHAILHSRRNISDILVERLFPSNPEQAP